jgi:hypothetical protein
MAKPVLGPKVIVSAVVRPALQRAERARHSGTITHSQMAAWFRLSFVWPIERRMRANIVGGERILAGAILELLKTPCHHIER